MKKAKTLRPRLSLSKEQLLVFVIAFGVLGGLALYLTKAAPNPNLPGDLNGDNTVNISDLSILLSDFNTSNAAADINADGTVNVLDLSILLSHFGQSYTSGGGSAPFHIETWAYDDSCSSVGDCEGKGASSALVDQWVTYAEGLGTGKALSDCHTAGNPCKALNYLDTNRIYTVASCGSGCSVPIWNDAQENWWLHQPGYTDSSHRLLATYNGNTYANLLNQSVAAVPSWFQNYARTNLNSYDGFMMDDQAGSLKLTVYGSGYTSSQEITTDAQVLSMHQQISAAMTHSDGSPFIQVDNTLQVNPFNPQMGSFQLIGNPSSVVGIVAEGAPWSNGSMTGYYPTLLDSMAYVVKNTSGFLALLSYDSNGALQGRRVQAATILLGYEPGRLVSWSDLEQQSLDLNIWPEEGIYPTQPVQTMGAPSGNNCFSGNGNVCTVGGHNDIQVASGIYRREYKQCYNQGVAFGPCAAIVNTTGSAVTVSASWLTQTYSHQITMNGGDVQSGGTIDLSGAGFTAGSTSLPAHDAMLID